MFPIIVLAAALTALPFDDLTDWTTSANGHAVEVDGAELLLRAGERPQATFVSHELDASLLHTDGATFSGEITTDSVVVSATLVAMVDGPDGRLFVDDMRGRIVNGTQGWRRYEITVPPLPTAEKFVVGVLLVGGGEARFRNLTFAPKPIPEPDAAAVAYLDEAIGHLRGQFRDGKRMDWAAVRANALPAAAVDAHAAVRVVVAQLRDRHAAFHEPGIRERLLGGVVRPFEGRIMEGRFAYLSVPGFAGEANDTRATQYATSGQQMIQNLAAARPCGWIVDLRDSGGGNMWPRIAALGPLLGAGTLGMHIAGDDRAVWEYKHGAAWARTSDAARIRTTVENAIGPLDPAPPIAVLLSEQTASAGEALAIAFIGRPNTRSFGTPTAGYASANVAVTLSDGAVLAFPGGYTADRTGAVHEPRVDPDVIIDDGAPTQAVPQPALDWLDAACYGTEHD